MECYSAAEQLYLDSTDTVLLNYLYTVVKLFQYNVSWSGQGFTPSLWDDTHAHVCEHRKVYTEKLSSLLETISMIIQPLINLFHKKATYEYIFFN